MVQCFARELRLLFYFFVQSCVCLLHSFDVPKHFFIFRKFIGLHLFIIFRCHVFQMCSSISGLLIADVQNEWNEKGADNDRSFMRVIICTVMGIGMSIFPIYHMNLTGF